MSTKPVAWQTHLWKGARGRNQWGAVVNSMAFVRMGAKRGGSLLVYPGLGNDVAGLWVGTERDRLHLIAFVWVVLRTYG